MELKTYNTICYRCIILLLCLVSCYATVTKQTVATPTQYDTVSPYPHSYSPNTNTSAIPHKLTIGLIDVLTPDIISMVNFAAMRINLDTTVLPIVDLEVYCADVGNNDEEAEINSVSAAGYFINTLQSKVLVTGLADITKPVQYLAAPYNIPQISPLQSSYTLEPNAAEPSLLRMFTSEVYQSTFFVDLMRHFNWHQVLFIYSDDDYGIGGHRAFLAASANALIEFNYSINVVAFAVSSNVHSAAFRNQYEFISKVADMNRLRIRVLYARVDIGLAFWKLLADGGQTGPGYVYMVPVHYLLVITTTSWTDIYPYAVGAISFGPVTDPSPGFYEAFAEYMAANRTLYPRLRPRPFELWWYYDAMYVIATAVQTLMQAGIEFDNITAEALYKEMVIASQSSIQYTFSLWYPYRNTTFQSWNFKPNATLEYAITQNAIYSYVGRNFSVNIPFIFDVSQNTKPPSDGICHCKYGTCDFFGTCKCDENYTGENCTILVTPLPVSGSNVLVIALSIVFSVVGVGILLGFILWRIGVFRKEVKEDETSIQITEVIIGDRIGGGAFGDVFRGTWHGSNVALKRVKNKNQLQELRSEAAILKKLRHPNVLQFCGLYNDGTDEYIVTEFIQGGSLENYLKKHAESIRTKDILRMAKGAAAGMSLLEDLKIVHADLAARNLLVESKNGELTVKVADFGLSETLRAGGHYASGSKVAIRWSAPEVISEGSTQNSTKSDVWSFGVVLWEMINYGAEPYESLKNSEILPYLVNGYRLYVPSPPLLPASIGNLIGECWQLYPQERPTFKELFFRLSQILENLELSQPLTSQSIHRSSVTPRDWYNTSSNSVTNYSSNSLRTTNSSKSNTDTDTSYTTIDDNSKRNYLQKKSSNNVPPLKPPVTPAAVDIYVE